MARWWCVAGGVVVMVVCLFAPRGHTMVCVHVRAQGVAEPWRHRIPPHISVEGRAGARLPPAPPASKSSCAAGPQALWGPRLMPCSPRRHPPLLTQAPRRPAPWCNTSPQSRCHPS